MKLAPTPQNLILEQLVKIAPTLDVIFPRLSDSTLTCKKSFQLYREPLQEGHLKAARRTKTT